MRLIGRRLQDVRVGRGVTLAALAKDAQKRGYRVLGAAPGVSQQRDAIRQWLATLESGVSDQPAEVVQWLAKVLAVPAVALQKAWGEPEEHSLLRGDLKFTGWLIGQNQRDAAPARPGSPDSVTVAIYVTTARRIVTAYWAREGRRVIAQKAEMHMNSSMATLWIREIDKGRLGLASKAAWKAACTAAPELFSELPED